MRLGTHDGSFHADDCCAVAVVQLAHPGETVELVRTRDEDLLAACDLRVDVGFRHDPATGDFDHHQGGGAGERPDGGAYASFGLVWKQFGLKVCELLAPGADAAVLHARVDQALVAGIDANDVGRTISKPAFEGAPGAYGLASVLGSLNLSWDEDRSPAAVHVAFEEAVAVARRVIEREIAGQASVLRAESLVRAAITASDDPQLIELDRDMPWMRPIHEHAPDALFVLYPKTDRWAVQAVRITPEDFAARKSFPEAWGGLQAEDLVAVSGVSDAVFCHNKRFLAVARSRDGALALARAALAA